MVTILSKEMFVLGVVSPIMTDVGHLQIVTSTKSGPEIDRPESLGPVRGQTHVGRQQGYHSSESEQKV